MWNQLPSVFITWPLTDMILWTGIPYVSEAEQAKVKLAEFKGKLEQIQTDKGESEKHLALLKAGEAEMGKVLGIFDLRKRVDELRSWFREKTAHCHEVQECQDDWQSYYADQVRTKLHADWDGDFQLLTQKIVDPLRTVEPEVAETITGQLTDARGVFEANLFYYFMGLNVFGI